MPYKSDAQRRYFHANRARLESEGVDVAEWDRASKGKRLPERAKKSNADLRGLVDHAEDSLSGEVRLPPAAYAQLAALLGIGGAYAGAGPGGLMGLAAGAARGNTPEGLGRGLIRGGATGAGAGIGAGLGAGLGAMAGHPALGAGLGAGLGGLTGYLGSGAVMGQPAGRAREEDDMQGAQGEVAKLAAVAYVRGLVDKIPLGPGAAKAASAMSAAAQLQKLASAMEGGLSLFEAVAAVYQHKSAAYRHQIVNGLVAGLANQLRKTAARQLGMSGHPSSSVGVAKPGTGGGPRTTTATTRIHKPSCG